MKIKKFQINETLVAGIVVLFVLLGYLLFKNQNELSNHKLDIDESDPRFASCIEDIKSQEEAYKNDKLSSIETPEKYEVDTYNGPLSMLNLDISSSGAKKFFTKINEELAQTGINFGGKYSIVAVWLTGWGGNYFIVDRTNGKGVSIPFRINFSYIKDNSLLLTINRNTILWDDSGGFDYEYFCANTSYPGEFYTDLRPHYYLWDGNEFKNLGEPAPKNKFWEEWSLN